MPEAVQLIANHLDFEVRFSQPTEEGRSKAGQSPSTRPTAIGHIRCHRPLRKLEGRSVPMLWSHDPTQVIGSWSSIQAREDGLHVKGKLNLAVAKAQEVRALLQAGDVKGLSVGFSTIKDELKAGIRRILEARLMEVSCVAFPAVPGSAVSSVRSTQTQGNDMPEVTPVAAQDNAAAAEVRAIADRLSALEARANRPIQAAEIRNQPSDEQRAFNAFCRRGLERMEQRDVSALTVGTDYGGGVVPPGEFLNELQRNLVLFSPVRAVARVSGASLPEVLLPKRVGNLTATWAGETDASTQTAPTFDQQKITVYELRAFVDISNQLLEDSAFDLASELAFDYAEEFGRAEGAAFIAGDGTKKPSGILGDTDITPVTTAGAGVITADDVIGLFYSLPTFYASRAVFAMNRSTIGAIRKLKSSMGNYLWVDSLQAGTPPTLLGRPVVEMPDLPDVAAGALPIIFGDWSMGFRIFDRVSLAVLRDPFSQQTNGLVRFHARRRVGGAVTKAEAFRFLKVKAS